MFKKEQKEKLLRCGGRHYNFKKGMEICPQKDKCTYYESDIIKVNHQFASVKNFRNCSLHNSIKKTR